ncbi:MAG: MurR/RpiR family transcriptional regulator [Gammaproteobacteria bacterium]|nr:MurR/RpiR family transcriptional regulator [Gammaproteobacteria bacterium]
MSTFSRAEQRVANWVLTHPRQTAEATLAVVANACGTSEPTVIRFCRRLGLSGFRELSIRLTEAASKPGSVIHRAVNADDTISDAAAKVFDASIQSLMEVRSMLSTLPIDQAVGAMKMARSLVFVGLGASGHVANDACHKFFRLGIPCAAVNDTPGMLQHAAIAAHKDVFVFVSHTGRWPVLGDAARKARQRGATVVAITDESSTLATNASILFPLQATEDTCVFTPMSSRVTQLVLLDAIQVALALALGEVAAEHLQRTKLALSDLPSG